MNNIRISWIYVQNFKGFAQLTLSFEQCQAVILGGPNGYGKTTVFDAIEILLTGRIRRMEGYAPLHNNTTSMDNDEQKPLVYDTKSEDTVIVRAGILVDDKKIVLERHAEVAEMRNPVDFGPFQRVYYSDSGLEHLHEIALEDMQVIGLDDIVANYSFLYYLSQEEAVAFLKSKESERSRLIQQLFDTTRYEIPIQRLGEAVNQITRLAADYNHQKKAIDDEIKRLMTTADIKGEGDGEYVALSTDGTLPWDRENPAFSHENFNMWLTEGGVIDGMLYFIRNRDAFRQNNLNKAVNGLLQGDRLKRVATNFHYLESQRRSYKQYREIKRQYERLRLDGLREFADSVPDILVKEGIVNEDNLKVLENTRKNLVKLYNASNDMMRLKTDIIQRRDQLAHAMVINYQKFQTEKCPLCGARYEDSKKLLEQVDVYGRQLTQSMGGVNEVIVLQFGEYKLAFGKQVVEPCDAYYVLAGFNDELITYLDRIDVQQAKKDAKTIDQILGVQVDYKREVEENVELLTKQLSGKVVTIDDSVDMNWMDRIFNSYMKFLDWRNLTEKQVMGKRAYLINLWNKKMSEALKEKTAVSKMLGRFLTICDQRKNIYKRTKKSLEAQRDRYVEEIISDIQILYYIYSGRIMQDCHYGRGLLMKPDFGRKRILFVAGSYKSDVDALYNMSSGQLVSLSIAFMLALNKLYAHCAVLAIDDPVQTIDDINLWGLIETLRHDFNNHFLLLSTHEQDYSQLLTNKFEKWGIRTNLIDMGEVRKTN